MGETGACQQVRFWNSSRRLKNLYIWELIYDMNNKKKISYTCVLKIINDNNTIYKKKRVDRVI